MAIDWKDASPASAKTPTGRSNSTAHHTASSTGNPWFALSLGLIGIIAGYLIGTFVS